MTYVEWPSTVNKRFYNLTRNPQDNFIETEYTSGRKVKVLKNTRFVHDIKCSIRVNKSEELAFWSWFEDTLGGCAGIFKCTALQRNTAYFRFSATPSEAEGLVYREISLEIEEVY